MSPWNRRRYLDQQNMGDPFWVRSYLKAATEKTECETEWKDYHKGRCPWSWPQAAEISVPLLVRTIAVSPASIKIF